MISAAPFRRTMLAGAFWTAIGTLFALPDLTTGHDPRTPLLASLVEWWSWGLVAPLIAVVDDRLAFRRSGDARRPIARAAVALVITIAWLLLHAVLSSVAHVGCNWTCLADGRLVHDALHGSILWGLLVYGLILGVHEVVVSRERIRVAELRVERSERNFSQARLNALRMQLDPHFLFNALNTISAHVVREPKVARAMIEHLGDLLRVSLDSQHRQDVPLFEEVAFLEHYLAIQHVRFGDALRVTLDVDADVADAVVPSLILQPLVENAIRHGISSRAAGGSIAVSARRRDDRLTIVVADDGVGLAPGWSLTDDAGIGLSTTRERIAVIHGGAGRFEVASRVGGGTEVTIDVPLRPMCEANVVAVA